MANKTFSILIIILLTFGCKKDACESVICVNGGDCLHGSCYCPTGYYGSDCSQQFTPNIIIIDSLVVTNFPFYDSSNLYWDEATDTFPDLFPEIILYSGTDTAYWSYRINFNSDTNKNHTFTPFDEPEDVVYDFTKPTNKYRFNLWDYDNSSSIGDYTDDLMGQIDFTPYNSSNKFPSVIRLDSAGLSTDIYISYIW
tara:strand:+ start:160 stop:750 length:591 start_codon:yes stop_codon:yes gene_type:complete